MPDAAVRVEFLAGVNDQLYRLSATALIRDTLGNSGEVDFEVWSHILPVESEEDIDSLLAAVSELAEVSGPLLTFASEFPDFPDPEADPTLQEPRLRRARMVRVYAINAASDGYITIGELERLVQGAMLFGEEESTSSEVR